MIGLAMGGEGCKRSEGSSYDVGSGAEVNQGGQSTLLMYYIHIDVAGKWMADLLRPGPPSSTAAAHHSF